MRKKSANKIDLLNKKNVENYLSGNNDSVSNLYKDNYEFVKTTLKMKLNNNDILAEDLAQDVMIRMIKNLESFKNTDTLFRSWLSSIIKSVFIDYVRKEKKMFKTEILEYVINENEGLDEDLFENSIHNYSNVSNGNILTEICNNERNKFLHDIINNLENPTRRRIMKKLLQGKSYKEISYETGEPIGTIKSIIFKVKKELKENQELSDMYI